MTGCIIGSFRKYYQDIVKIIENFEEAGIEILSPKISSIINPGDEFVILASDDENLSKEQIQSKVFENERNSDFVYVWDPDGYIGRTTCYEMGCINTHGDKPVFYKERPKDIPITIKDEDILSVDEVIKKVLAKENLN